MQLTEHEKHTETNDIPFLYQGRLLKQDRSPLLKKCIFSYIEKLKAINEFLLPSILYIAAWENNNKTNDIWYEYAGENFQHLFDSDVKNLPEIFRNSVIDRKIYLKNENKVKIQTQNKNFLLNKKISIRTELENSGFNEAVYKIKIKDHIIWLKDQAVVIPFEEDKITVSIGNLTNVTKEMEAEESRKKAEKALAKKEKLLRALFNQAYDPIVITDLKGKILDCNEKAEAVFGYSRKDMLRHNYKNFLVPEELEKLEKQIKNLSLSKPVKTEILIYSKSKEMISTEINIVEIDNTPPVIQCLIRDISEKKELEKERVKRSKFELLSTMASGIAHDINNILSIVLGNLSLAEMEAEKIKNSSISEILMRIEKASTHLEMLTKKFFTFSQTPFIVKKEIDAYIYMESFSKKYKDEMSLIIDKKMGLILKINSKMMESAIDSILRNSIESMISQKEKKVEIKIEKKIISQGKRLSNIMKNGEYVKISIKDNGCGIPEKDIDRVFDPYFSTKPLTSKKGTGLGLTNAHSIIKQHNGHMEINSDENTGTTATIYLPG